MDAAGFQMLVDKCRDMTALKFVVRSFPAAQRRIYASVFRRHVPRAKWIMHKGAWFAPKAEHDIVCLRPSLREIPGPGRRASIYYDYGRKWQGSWMRSRQAGCCPGGANLYYTVRAGGPGQRVSGKKK